MFRFFNLIWATRKIDISFFHRNPTSYINWAPWISGLEHWVPFSFLRVHPCLVTHKFNLTFVFCFNIWFLFRVCNFDISGDALWVM